MSGSSLVSLSVFIEKCERLGREERIRRRTVGRKRRGIVDATLFGLNNVLVSG